MTGHERFRFRIGNELRDKALSLGFDLPYSQEIGSLFTPLSLGRLTIPNRLVIQPMEGADAGEDGTPGPLTFRRYKRFAAGGAGLIWFEAAAVVEAGRSNAHQLLLSPSNLSAFKRLVSETRAAAASSGAPGPAPLLILQLSPSGTAGPPRPPPSETPISIRSVKRTGNSR
jgi:2,4-dienoyl-CoA reductase (NADPH2)